MTQDVHELVKKKYGQIIQSKRGCSCGDSDGGCCGKSFDKATQVVTGGLYSEQELEGIPQDLLQTSLGCGNPTALTALHAGEAVLDLGSGAGLDVMLSAKRVGPTGKAYGLDMTDEMLAAAKANLARTNLTNVEFLKGNIEKMPLPDASIDVIISNCVINLSPDKQSVFSEAFRVLRPGGRIAVSDILVTRELPDKVKDSLLAWAGCVAGALSEAAYKAKLHAAGFTDISTEVTRVYALNEHAALLPNLPENELQELNGAIVSAFIRAKKPAISLSGISISSATIGDYPTIADLLVDRGLETDGVKENIGQFFVAKVNDEIVGIVGVERSGRAGLLRSFAVQHAWQKAGIGEKLIKAACESAKTYGVTDMYLLTNTAASYFSGKGFVRVEREDIPTQLLESSALHSICPVTSACLHKKL